MVEGWGQTGSPRGEKKNRGERGGVDGKETREFRGGEGYFEVLICKNSEGEDKRSTGQKISYGNTQLVWRIPIKVKGK